MLFTFRLFAVAGMDEKTFIENNDLYVFGPFRLDVAERRLLKDGEPVALARKAFDLLLILVEAAGHLKTREELIEALWPKNIVEEQGLTTKMHALRKALGDEGTTPQFIETVRGVGYRFIAAVTVEKAAPARATLRPSAEMARKRRRWLATGLASLAVVAIAAGLIAWFLAVRPARSAVTTVAVLPFENLSADKANAYFASGIQDTILTRLAGIRDLRVISRSSTASYASRPANLRQVAEELGADAVLEGSVQKTGQRVLINVQLINARTDAHIWAATYTRTLDDVFGVEGDVATKIAAALMAKLQPAQAARLAQSPTQDPEAYVLFLKANYHADQALNRADAKDTDAVMEQAITLYRQAIARDPDFALAWARLSLLESYAYWFGIDYDSQRIAKAEQAAKRALALDPDLPQAHMAMGYVAYYGLKDYAAALAQFRQARERLPNDSEVIGAIAFIHRRQGKWDAALEGLRRAAALNPRNSRWPNETAITLSALRRYAQAEQQFDQALAIEPDNYDAMVRKTWVLLLAGKLEQARLALAKIPSDVRSAGTRLLAALRRRPVRTQTRPRPGRARRRPGLDGGIGCAGRAAEKSLAGQGMDAEGRQGANATTPQGRTQQNAGAVAPQARRSGSLGRSRPGRGRARREGRGDPQRSPCNRTVPHLPGYSRRAGLSRHPGQDIRPIGRCGNSHKTARPPSRHAGGKSHFSTVAQARSDLGSDPQGSALPGTAESLRCANSCHCLYKQEWNYPKSIVREPHSISNFDQKKEGVTEPLITPPQAALGAVKHFPHGAASRATPHPL